MLESTLYTRPIDPLHKDPQVKDAPTKFKLLIGPPPPLTKNTRETKTVRRHPLVYSKTAAH